MSKKIRNQKKLSNLEINNLLIKIERQDKLVNYLGEEIRKYRLYFSNEKFNYKSNYEYYGYMIEKLSSIFLKEREILKNLRFILFYGTN
jgi:hypothetical protein